MLTVARAAAKLVVAGTVAAFAWGAIGVVEAQSLELMPYEYRDALLGPAYEVQSADINSDGQQDLVLRSRNPFVLAGLPLAIELQWRASFLVLSNADGEHHLDLTPRQELLDSVLWQSETHEVLYGDVDGDGSTEALVRALRPASLSVLLTTSPQNGAPLLLQQMNYDDLGVDLGEAGLQVDLYDISGDGLADLVTGQGLQLNTAHFSGRRQGAMSFASEPTIDAVAADGFPTSTLVAAPLAGPQERAQVNAIAAGPVVPGSMIGAFQVTPNGGASYSMALTLPPGLGGMTPQLAIEYNNNAPDTGLGLGMTLNGLSQISRCPSTWRDTSASGIRGPDAVNFNDADFFCLDGQKLVTTGTYGALNQTYQTQMTSFSLIKSVSSTSTRNPDTWTVQTKAGLKLTYGGAGYIWNGNRTNQTYAWLLKKSEDTTGNVIDYEYEFPVSGTVQTSYRIKEIRYGGNPAAGLSHKSRVAFSYVNRNGYQPRGYMYGSVFQRNYVMEKIEAFTTGTSEVMTRSWNFTYHAPEQATNPYPPGTTPPPCRPGKPCQQQNRAAQLTSVQAQSKTQSLSRYAMTSIQECAGSANSAAVPCLPSTTFAWASAIGGPSGAMINANVGTYNADWSFTNGDVNGDGHADMLAIKTVVGDGVIQVFPKGNNVGAPATTQLSSARPQKKPQWTTGDFNGDGRLDVAFYFEEGDCGNPIMTRYGMDNYLFTAEVKVEMDTRTGPNCTAGSTSHPPTGISYRDVSQIVAGDVDGDGRDDLIMISNRASSGFEIRHLISTGTGYTIGNWRRPAGTGIGAGENVSNYRPYAGDFNGDGKIDIAVIEQGSSTVKAFICLNGGASCTNAGTILNVGTATFAPMVGDSNGDGYADIILARRDGLYGYAYTFLSTGMGTLQTAVPTTQILQANNDYRVSAGDFDGDGALDLVWVDEVTPHDISLMAGTGTGAFSNSETILGGFEYLPKPNYSLLPGDYDGDGKADLGAFGRNSSGQGQIRLAKFTGASNLRVGTITSGLGSSVEIEYLPLTSTSVYGDTSAYDVYPIRRLSVPQYVVRAQNTKSDGLETRTMTYSYYGSRLDVQGRGPLGFSSATIRDAITGNTESTIFRQDYPFIGMPSETTTRALNNLLIAAESYTYDQQPSQQGSLLVYPSTVTSKRYETTSGFSGLITSTVTQTIFGSTAAKNYGNPTKTTVNVYAGDVGASTPFVTTTENSYDNFVDNGRWYIGRLKRAKVTKANPAGDTDYRTTDFEYDPITGLLSAEIVEPTRIDHLTEGNQYVRTEYGRDAVGNIVTTTVRANVKSGESWALQSRTSSASYSELSPNFKRFRTGECNAVSGALQACTTIVPDVKSGNALTSTDANGISTSASYDAFGRQLGTSFINAGKTLTTTIARFWCATPSPSTCFDEPNGIYAVESTASTGDRSIVVYDGYEREIRNASIGPDGTWRYTRNVYNLYGQLNSARSAGGYWTSYVYDGIQGRAEVAQSPSKESNLTGRTLRTSYRGLTTVSWDARDNPTTTEVNVEGKVVRVTNALDQAMSYEYDAFGNMKKTHDPAGNEIVATFDRRGRKRTVTDPDLGKWTYDYNGFGEVVSQKDAKGQVTTYLYDSIGRLIQRNEYLSNNSLESSTAWTYDTLNGNTRKGFLFEVRQTNASGAELSRRTYLPDAVGNVASESLYIDGVNQGTTSRTYDSSNRVDALTYPSGLVLKHRYNAQGALYQLRQNNDSGFIFWEANSWDSLGKINQSALGNGLIARVTRDQAVGLEREIQVGSGSIQKWTYDWDANGNTTSRANGVGAIAYTEGASYDALNRIDTVTLTTASSSSSKQTLYDSIGNIQSFSDSGTYSYDPTKRPHAVTSTTIGARAFSYDANGNMLWGDAEGGRRNYTWAVFNMPTQITQGAAIAQFRYGPDREKIRQISSSPLVPGRTAYYLNNVSEKHVTASGTEYRELIVAPTGVIAQTSYYPSSGVRNTLYVHTDKLGSIDAVTNDSGQNLALINTHPGFGYDQWGKRRDDSGGGGPSNLNFAILKGYTAHDMLDTLNLIHMHGRVYDPAIGRFLSPDPVVQDPNDLQSYNRYSYASNNPLTNTDPNGYSWLSKGLKKIGGWVKDNWQTIATIAIAIAAPYAAAWAFNTTIAGLTLGQATIAGAVGGFAGGLVGSRGDIKAALIGAASGAAFGAVGAKVGNPKWGEWTQMFKKVTAHGLVGGAVSVAQGGRFGQGVLSAGVSAFFSPKVGELGSPGAGVAASAILGGTAAEVGGGKFSNGAQTAAMQYGLGEIAHIVENRVQAQSGQTVVEVRYNDLAGGYKHAYIVVTLPDGQEWFIRGQPSYQTGGVTAVSGASVGASEGQWGDLVVVGGKYEDGTIDYTTAPAARQVVFTTTGDPGLYINRLTQFGNMVNQAGITYNPISMNSNTFAHQAVTILGVQRPNPAAFAPASNSILPEKW